MNNWKVSSGLIGALISCQALATPHASDNIAIRVRYDHRQLSSADGALHLLDRINKAALESCGASTFSLREIQVAAMASSCRRIAVDDAVRRIDEPALTELARTRR